MNTNVKQSIEAATVKLLRMYRGKYRPIGRGVLVPGGFVLTAAHNVRWSVDGRMAGGGSHVEVVETCNGERFAMAVTAVEPVADIAVLEAMDDQAAPDDAEAFDNWCDSTEPVPISRRLNSATTSSRLSVQAALRNSEDGLYILTHTSGWLRGAVFLNPHTLRRRGDLRLDVEAPILKGTSGSPIVDSSGELVGLVSTAKVVPQGEPTIGRMPFAFRALPRWVSAEISSASSASGARRGGRRSESERDDEDAA